jgi:hypothetical protein
MGLLVADLVRTPVLSIFADFHQFSSIFVNFHQFSSIFINFCWFLSISVNFHQFSSIFVIFRPFLSIVVDFHRFLQVPSPNLGYFIYSSIFQKIITTYIVRKIITYSQITGKRSVLSWNAPLHPSTITHWSDNLSMARTTRGVNTINQHKSAFSYCYELNYCIRRTFISQSLKIFFL